MVRLTDLIVRAILADHSGSSGIEGQFRYSTESARVQLGKANKLSVYLFLHDVSKSVWDAFCDENSRQVEISSAKRQPKFYCSSGSDWVLLNVLTQCTFLLLCLSLLLCDILDKGGSGQQGQDLRRPQHAWHLHEDPCWDGVDREGHQRRELLQHVTEKSARSPCWLAPCSDAHAIFLSIMRPGSEFWKWQYWFPIANSYPSGFGHLEPAKWNFIRKKFSQKLFSVCYK